MEAQALAAQLGAGTVPGAQPPAAAPTAVVSATAAPTADPLDRLEKLAQLHSAGALTDEEFAAQKAKLLEQM